MDEDVLTAGLVESIPVLGPMGVRVVDASPGHAATSLPLAPNGNHFGVAYAGSLVTAAELLGGVLAGSTIKLEGYYPLVRDFSIDFRRPATTDVIARASLPASEVERIRGEALASGKAEYDVHATVTDEQGVVVATTVGRYQIRRAAGV